ncbi:phage portal protein [Sphingomonas sp. CCH9-F2]|jgi:HK97 family phage portal protein|uniref:phage portal protein n=1 Tax=Sphingomonas sp. CCH9-F2 TaxID=1768778 RepID=UPI000830B0A0|nr:phage portal protein [Sphingomonas sp. CCH9-F2]
MRTTAISPDGYRRPAIRYDSGIATAEAAMPSRPAPSNVTDGRFYGDDGDMWSMLSALPVEANTAETAARVAAVFFCVSLIAEAVGSLSLDFKDDGGLRADFPLANTLAYEPNPLQTGAEFWAAMAFCAVLRGEAFAEPVAGPDGVEVWPLHPSRTVSDWGERSLVVHYQSDRAWRRLLPQQLFWFTGLADGGLRPLVPWKQAKGAIDFQLALEVGARAFFRNDRRPSGVLSTDSTLTDASAARLKEGVDRWRRGGTPVLEAGVKYQAVGISNVDAQLVELIKQRTLEMGRYWRIPRSIIGDDAGGNAASDEQDTRRFVNWALRPLTRRMEQAITVRMLPPDLRAQRVRAKFNLDSMLRGDAATQWKNAVLARTAGILSVNTIGTQWFGQPRIDAEWADDPRAPLNSNRAADTTTGGETAPQDKVQ